MAKSFVGRFLERISLKNGDERQERRREAAESIVRGYQRVPSHGTISASTTSTSLVTDFDPNHYTRHPNFAFFEPTLKEEDCSSASQEDDDEGEDFETTRLHFQQHRQISIGTPKMEMNVRGGNKNENLRNVVPFVKQLSSDKMKEEYTLDIDGTTYKPTTTKINFLAQLMAALTVSLASLVVGFTSGYTSPALASMSQNASIIVTKDEASWIGGMMPLAGLVGGLCGGFLIVKFGRRNTILVTSVPFIISWIVIASASDVYVIYVGRAMGGLCVGIGSLVFPVYLGETLQPEVRGQLGLLPTAFGNVGVLISYIAGMYMDWSALAYFGALIPLPFLVLAFLIPETPRWYVSKGNHKAARESLLWLRGKHSDVGVELKEIINAHEEAERTASPTPIFDLFRKNNIRGVLILLCLMFLQQMSGINAVIFYTVSIFKSAGSTVDENISTIIVGVVNFLATFVATLLIDRLGRKILLYISSVMMIITLSVLGAYFYMKSAQMDVDAYGWLPLVSVVMYTIGFSFGFGPIPWLMMGEILPGRVKGAAASLVTAFNWTCTFVVTKTFHSIIEAIGEHGAFWMFAGICTVGLFFTIGFVPETKGKSLEDIEQKINPTK